MKIFALVKAGDYSIWLTPCAKTASLSAVMTQATQIIAFLEELLRLKAVPRTGWLLRGVREVESVADHSFGVAWVAMLLADRARAQGHAVDAEKVLRMALLHDLTEARTGDFPATIKRYFAPGALPAAEERIAAEMLADVGVPDAPYLTLWHEYEARATLEARLVKAADKLDLLLQACAYERGGARTMHEFWQRAEQEFAALGLAELVTDLLTTLRESRR